MTRVIFTRFAQQELEDAVRYYELEYSGLGRRFKEEVRRGFGSAAHMSQAHSPTDLV